MITHEHLTAAGFFRLADICGYGMQMGPHGDYWLYYFLPNSPADAHTLALILDEDVLFECVAITSDELRRAVIGAQAAIDQRIETLKCRDLDDLTESLGMGRLFGTAK